MHDITDLELRGIPGMLVASTEFIKAAAAQGKALGFEPPACYVPHPIQDRSGDEIRALAEAAFNAILSRIAA